MRSVSPTSSKRAKRVQHWRPGDQSVIDADRIDPRYLLQLEQQGFWHASVTGRPNRRYRRIRPELSGAHTMGSVSRWRTAGISMVEHSQPPRSRIRCSGIRSRSSVFLRHESRHRLRDDHESEECRTGRARAIPAFSVWFSHVRLIILTISRDQPRSNCSIIGFNRVPVVRLREPIRAESGPGSFWIVRDVWRVEFQEDSEGPSGSRSLRALGAEITLDVALDDYQGSIDLLVSE